MMICKHSLIWSFAILVAGVNCAFACGNGKLLFEDKFESLDPEWHLALAQDDPTRSNGPEGLVYKFDPNLSFAALNNSSLYDDLELCAVFTTETTGGGYVGVKFWASDKSNNYEASIFPTFGTFGVYRYQKDKLITPITPTNSDAIHKGTNVTNEISVTVKGKKATLAINDKKVIDFSGQPPEGGSLIGFAIGTQKDDTGPTTFTLKSIQVREVGTTKMGSAQP